MYFETSKLKQYFVDIGDNETSQPRCVAKGQGVRMSPGARPEGAPTSV